VTGRAQPCGNPTHGRGSLGETVRVTPAAVYRRRTCDVCGRVQGTARIPAVTP
jgi:hypothetical protein